MAALLFQIFSFSTLVSLGLYHLFCTTRNYLKSPQSYTAKPYHPFPPFSQTRLKHLQLFLLISCLFLAFLHQAVISTDSDPLLKGNTPVHRFTSLQSAAVLFLFLVLSVSLLLSELTSLLPLPHDLFFALASGSFFLHSSSSSSAASVQTSNLEAKCDSVSSTISLISAVCCLVLACKPKLFVADVVLGASLCLQGFWALQTGLSLHVDAFIPDGCHKLLDVVSGVQGSTQCELEESKLRAVAILDLIFVIHVIMVVIIFIAIYAATAKVVGMRRLGSYEALATNSADSNHVQMKTLTGTQA